MIVVYYSLLTFTNLIIQLFLISNLFEETLLAISIFKIIFIPDLEIQNSKYNLKIKKNTL